MPPGLLVLIPHPISGARTSQLRRKELCPRDEARTADTAMQPAPVAARWLRTLFFNLFVCKAAKRIRAYIAIVASGAFCVRGGYSYTVNANSRNSPGA